MFLVLESMAGTAVRRSGCIRKHLLPPPTTTTTTTTSILSTATTATTKTIGSCRRNTTLALGHFWGNNIINPVGIVGSASSARSVVSGMRLLPPSTITTTTTTITTSSSLTPHRRFLATAAQRRKLERKGFIKERGRSMIVEKEQLTTLTKESLRQRQGFQWSPAIVFLVVFPIVMTGLVVAIRGDLRQQVMDMSGIGGSSSSSSTTDPKVVPTTTTQTKEEQ